MQDIHSIGGGSRLFNAGGGGGGDRRLRPQNHQNIQALKCPRCDSLNTKFCYYNNYNLSQPRHFCKSCRRYWTKGGVLRNVPVGGGCRKTKRSNKPKQTTSTTDMTTVAITIPPPEQQQSEELQQEQQQQRQRKSSNSHSSSESSSLTATNTASASAAAGNTALEVASAHSSSSVSNHLLNGINESKPFSNINSSSRGGLLEQGSDCGIFSEIGSFTSLITSANDHLGFGFSNLIQQDHNQQWQHPPPPQKIAGLNEGMKLHESMAAGGYIDQTVQVELSELQSSRSGNNGGFGTLDWQGTGDHQGLFDLPNAVDHTYWNQSQWSYHDQPSLYLP